MLPGRPAATRTVERIDDACEADERVLDHLAKRGCDLSSPREARHFLYLPARLAADHVADVLDADGWSTSVEQSDDAWLVVATRRRALTSRHVRETRSQLASLASDNHGVYDGWEVPLTR